MNISLPRHEASTEYRIGQKLGLEGRGGLFRGTSHFRDAGYPLCQHRLLVHTLLSVYPDPDASSLSSSGAVQGSI